MKALTLTQPWATLVAIGAKQVETRSWSTAYRGLIAIHAAKGYPKLARALCATEPFKSALMRAPLMGLSSDPADNLGVVLCICELWACKPTEIVAHVLSDTERAFGDYAPGRYAWGLRKARVLDTPERCRGALGLWEWPTDDTAGFATRKVQA